MGISKLVDNRYYKHKKQETIQCKKNIKDCMFLMDDNECCAEWCIFEELPKVINLERKITCSICNINSKTVSVYSGQKDYICEECINKIREKINE